MLPPFLVFIIILSILVFVHELGHFLAAKKAGIKVEEFGFGYPPKIWAKKIGETIYSINLVPFGGFVSLLGQELKEKKHISKKDLKKAFFNKSKASRIIVLLAGVLGNFVLGVLCFTIIYSKLGFPKDLGYVRFVDVVSGSPADKAGIKKEDKLILVDNQEVYSVEGFVKTIEEKKGRQVVIKTSRGNHTLAPREDPPEGEGRLGVIITDTETAFYPWWQTPFLAAWYGLKEAIAWGIMVVAGVIITFQQLVAGIAPEVAGPVGIFQLTSQAARQGILEVVQFVGILSVNLAVLNLLPIPALDGAHLVFVFIGDWLGEKRREKVEHTVNLIGFIVLISLMILVTINDFARLFKNSALVGFLKNIIP